MNGAELPTWRSLLEQWLPVGGTGSVWGVDVGGANLKVACLQLATRELTTRSLPFALWQTPERLASGLQELTTDLPPAEQVAITMTGEIADCYPHKREGVAAIVDHCETAFSTGSNRVAYYTQAANAGACFCEAEIACRQWMGVAASNWHAVATLWGGSLAERFQGAGLIADLGSTTLDLTIVSPNQVVAAQTDFQRVGSGGLVYTGLRRSPLAMILPQMEFQGRRLPLAQELFATIGDVYLLTGDLTAAPDQRDTADGRAATVAQAAQRLARMLCSDADELPSGVIAEMVRQGKAAHQLLLTAAIERQLLGSGEPPSWVLMMGEGEHLLRQAVATGGGGGGRLRPLLSAAKIVGPMASEVLPALSVAVLAVPGRFIQKELGHD